MKRSRSDKNEQLRPCVFLDRDGTVSRESGYVNHPDRIELLPGSGPAIRRLNEKGVLTILTTNQAGVARGYLSEAVLKQIHRRLERQLAERGARLDAIYYAATHPDGTTPEYRRDDDRRKPQTGMIREACSRFPIDMARSYVVGDKEADILLAHNAGLKSVFVLSGYGLGEYTYRRQHWKRQPHHVAEDLRAAVKWILKDLRETEKRGREAAKRASAARKGKT